MTASEVLHLLQQVPPRHELVVIEGNYQHRIFNLGFSHEPAQVTLRLWPSVPVPTPKETADLFNENNQLRDLNADLLLEIERLKKERAMIPTEAEMVQVFGDASPTVSANPAFTDGFAHWWDQEGSGMAPSPDEDKAEHTRRLCEIAWSNGAYVKKYPTPEAACAPEPTIAEQVVAAAKAKRRRAKTAPFGTV